MIQFFSKCFNIKLYYIQSKKKGIIGNFKMEKKLKKVCTGLELGPCKLTKVLPWALLRPCLNIKHFKNHLK